LAENMNFFSSESLLAKKEKLSSSNSSFIWIGLVFSVGARNIKNRF